MTTTPSPERQPADAGAYEQSVFERLSDMLTGWPAGCMRLDADQLVSDLREAADLLDPPAPQAQPDAPTQSAAQTGEVTRDWLVSVIQQHTFAQDAADMILAALSQPEPSQ